MILFIVTTSGKVSRSRHIIEHLHKQSGDNRGFMKLKEQGLSDEFLLELRESFHADHIDKQNDDLVSLIEDFIKREEGWLNVARRSGKLKEKRMSIESDYVNLMRESNLAYLYSFLIGCVLNIYTVMLVILDNL